MILFSIVGYWSNHQFNAIRNVLPAVVGTTLIVLGAQKHSGRFSAGRHRRERGGFFEEDCDSGCHWKNFSSLRHRENEWPQHSN
jgi:hypothetical protein